MSECVTWEGYLDPDGYGRRSKRGNTTALVHRQVWEEAHGPIPKGLTIDHLCRNRACVNVDHMEVVDRVTNILRGEGPTAQNARKTYCAHGHPLDEANTYIRPDGTRDCRKCMVIRNRRYRERVPA